MSVRPAGIITVALLLALSGIVGCEPEPAARAPEVPRAAAGSGLRSVGRASAGASGSGLISKHYVSMLDLTPIFSDPYLFQSTEP